MNKFAINLILFFSFTAGAAETALTRYSVEINQREDIHVLAELKSFGIDSVGGKTIEEIIRDAGKTKIEILPNDDVRFLNPDGSVRKSAKWQIDEKGNKTIYFSLDEARKALGQDVRQGLFLHENFGAADRNFSNSSLIREALKRKRLQDLPPALLKKSLNQMGGTSGVGGGGDYRIQYYVDLFYFFMFQRNFSGEQILNITCFLNKKIDFDIDAQLPAGQLRSETQMQSDGSKKVKILFPEPQSFGSFDEEAYMADYDQNLPMVKGLLLLFLNNSFNACLQ